MKLKRFLAFVLIISQSSLSFAQLETVSDEDVSHAIRVLNADYAEISRSILNVMMDPVVLNNILVIGPQAKKMAAIGGTIVGATLTSTAFYNLWKFKKFNASYIKGLKTSISQVKRDVLINKVNSAEDFFANLLTSQKNDGEFFTYFAEGEYEGNPKVMIDKLQLLENVDELHHEVFRFREIIDRGTYEDGIFKYADYHDIDELKRFAGLIDAKLQIPAIDQKIIATLQDAGLRMEVMADRLYVLNFARKQLYETGVKAGKAGERVIGFLPIGLGLLVISIAYLVTADDQQSSLLPTEKNYDLNNVVVDLEDHTEYMSKIIASRPDIQ